MLRQKVIEDHGEKKYDDILEKIEDPEKVELNTENCFANFY